MKLSNKWKIGNNKIVGIIFIFECILLINIIIYILKKK